MNDHMLNIDAEEKIWIKAATQVLEGSSRSLHYTEIKREILQQKLVAPGLTTTLDAALVKECAPDNPRSTIIEDAQNPGYYLLKAKEPKNVPAPPKKGKRKLAKLPVVPKQVYLQRIIEPIIEPPAPTDSPGPSAVPPKKVKVLSKYEKKYHLLKRRAKDIIFMNAAYCDEIVNTQKEIAIAEAERRYLLDIVLKREAMIEKPNGIAAAPESNNKAPAKQTKRKTVSHKNESTEPSKPKPRKRAKPKGTQPSSRAKSAQQNKGVRFPIELNNLKIHAAGNVLLEPSSVQLPMHMQCPVGFHSSRKFTALSLQQQVCWYTCRRLDKNCCPEFEIITEDGEYSFVGSSPDECHAKLIQSINSVRKIEIQPSPGSGNVFFGLTEPTVQRLFQGLPIPTNSRRGANSTSKKVIIVTSPYVTGANVIPTHLLNVDSYSQVAINHSTNL